MNDLDRLLELRWDNSIEYLEDDSDRAKEYQSLKAKIQGQIEFANDFIKKHEGKLSYEELESQIVKLKEEHKQLEKYKICVCGHDEFEHEHILIKPGFCNHLNSDGETYCNCKQYESILAKHEDKK